MLTQKLGTLEFQVGGIAWVPDDSGHRIQVCKPRACVLLLHLILTVARALLDMYAHCTTGQHYRC